MNIKFFCFICVCIYLLGLPRHVCWSIQKQIISVDLGRSKSDPNSSMTNFDQISCFSISLSLTFTLSLYLSLPLTSLCRSLSIYLSHLSLSLFLNVAKEASCSGPINSHHNFWPGKTFLYLRLVLLFQNFDARNRAELMNEKFSEKTKKQILDRTTTKCSNLKVFESLLFKCQSLKVS